jgi:hypothetical protein
MSTKKTTSIRTLLFGLLGTGLLLSQPVSADETQFERKDTAKQTISYASHGERDANVGQYEDQPTLYIRDNDHHVTYIDVASDTNDVGTLDAYLMRSDDDESWGGFYGVQNAAFFTPQYIESRDDLIEDVTSTYKEVVEDDTRSSIRVSIDNYLNLSKQTQGHPPDESIETPLESRLLTFYVTDVENPDVEYRLRGRVNGMTTEFAYINRETGVSIDIKDDPSSVVRGKIHDLAGFTYDEVLERLLEKQESIHSDLEY